MIEPRRVIFFKTKVSIAADLFFGAEDEARTRDPNLGKVVLYQLSYFCRCPILFVWDCKGRQNILSSKLFCKKIYKKCTFFMKKAKNARKMAKSCRKSTYAASDGFHKNPLSYPEGFEKMIF